MKRLFVLVAVALGSLSLMPAAGAAVESGNVVVVQALPGAKIDVVVDGRTVRKNAEVGSTLGPFPMAPGSHQMTFTGGSVAVRTTIDVAAGSSSDVVLHEPASVSGAPVVNTYRTPTSPIGPGKARLLLAHTATVAPADVSFDGSVVFRDIANGEFAEADVPAGQHKVALLPAGLTADPILGPLKVDLAPRTVTMVYAVGNPSDKSMAAVVHTVDLPADGSQAPQTIKTGSAGLAGATTVHPFGDSTRSADRRGAGTALSGWLLGGAAVGASVLVLRRERARDGDRGSAIRAPHADDVLMAGRRWRERRARQRSIWLVAALCAVVVLSVLWQRADDPAKQAAAAPAPAAAKLSDTDAVPARRVGAVVPEDPVDLRLPDGTLIPVVAAATRSDGLLDVPDDVHSAGWWPGGSRLGDPLGSTLVAAHVDSTTQGLGPYAALLGARRGQQVVVRSKTLVQTFSVVSLQVVPQGSLADHAWIYGASGKRRLTMVTCAPPYDRARGGYQNLAVVTAVPTGPPSRRGS